jgi:hypothetical protein
VPIVTVGRIFNQNRLLILPPGIARELKINESDKIEVRFGALSAQVTVRYAKNNSNDQKVFIAAETADALCIPDNLCLRIKRELDTLRFGPVIGIFVNKTRSAIQPFLNQTSYFRALVRMGRGQALPTYLFTAKDINWQNKTVQAWIVRKRSWKRMRMPLPDVIYDRVQTRKWDYLPSVRRAKKHFQEAKIPMFNLGFLDKWNTFSLLSQTEAKVYLPQTQLVEKKEDIYQFARRYSSIYIKPVGGSLGQGIMVLWRKHGRYHLVHYGINSVRSLRYLKSPAPIWHRLRRLMKKRNYVVQQGLQLVRYHGRRFDFRLLMQKEGDNWKTSLIYARIAPLGSLRANLEAGGDAKRSLKVLRSCFKGRAQTVLKRITEAGIIIAKAIEHKSPGPIGELGLDIGVDRRGRPWIIEANAKPLRRMVGPKLRLYTSLKRPLHYAKELAGF